MLFHARKKKVPWSPAKSWRYRTAARHCEQVQQFSVWWSPVVVYR